MNYFIPNPLGCLQIMKCSNIEHAKQVARFLNPMHSWEAEKQVEPAPNRKVTAKTPSDINW